MPFQCQSVTLFQESVTHLFFKKSQWEMFLHGTGHKKRAVAGKQQPLTVQKYLMLPCRPFSAVKQHARK